MRARLTRACTLGALASVVTLMVFAPVVRAEPLVRLRRYGGELGGSIESITSGDAMGSRTEAPRSQLWLRVPFEGALVSTRLLSWSGSLRPSFQRGPAGGGGTVQVSETGYEMSARMFSASPFNLSGVAARTRGVMLAPGRQISSRAKPSESLCWRSAGASVGSIQRAMSWAYAG